MGFLPFFTSPGESWDFTLSLLRGCCSEAAASVQDLSQRLAKTQNPREPLKLLQSPPGEPAHIDHPKPLKDLSRGCTAEVPLPLTHREAWSLAGLSCSALAASHILHPFLCKHRSSEISCSSVTGKGGFIFLVHFRNTHMNQGRRKEASLTFLSLSTDRQRTPPCSHLCSLGSQPAPSPPSLPAQGLSLPSSLGSWETNSPVQISWASGFFPESLSLQTWYHGLMMFLQ